MDQYIGRYARSVDAKTGRLVLEGEKQIGLERLQYCSCVDCKSLYPIIKGQVRCNGHNIPLCPWCRPDSEPWKNGRGM